MPAAGGRNIHLAFEPEQFDGLDAAAEALDVNTGTFITAVVLGAMVSGNAVRLAMRGLDELPPARRKARARKVDVRRWEALRVDDVDDRKVAWVSGEYHLERVGNIYTAADRAQPGDGWYLIGGGFDHEYVGLRRSDAIKRADELIAIKERTEATT